MLQEWGFNRAGVGGRPGSPYIEQTRHQTGPASIAKLLTVAAPVLNEQQRR